MRKLTTTLAAFVIAVSAMAQTHQMELANPQ